MSNPRDMRQFVLSTLASAMNLFATQNLPAGTAQFRDGLNTLGFGRYELLDPGSVALPKFKLEYDATLKEPLVKLGLGIAFDRDRADFSRITERRPWTLHQ